MLSQLTKSRIKKTGHYMHSFYILILILGAKCITAQSMDILPFLFPFCPLFPFPPLFCAEHEVESSRVERKGGKETACG